MGCNPCGNSLLDGVQLIGGDVGSDQLAVGGVLLLIWPFDGCGQVKPEVGFNIVVRNTLADGVEHAEYAERIGVLHPATRLLHTIIAAFPATEAHDLSRAVGNTVTRTLPR